MAIQPVNTNNTINAAGQAKLANKSTLENKNGAINTAADDDTVNITSVAQDIKKASDTGISEPIINEKRVAEIKTAIEAGNYKIDPNRIADKMLQLEIKLPNST